MLVGRAVVLLAASHIFANAAVADICRSCEFSSGVPPELWRDFSRSLDALEKFTSADKALALRLAQRAGRQPASAGRVIGDPDLQRFTYPWKPEFWHGGVANAGRNDADEDPQTSGDTPSGPIWLSVPYARNDDADRRLTVSADDVRDEPVLATQSRVSGKWYWEVQFQPGTANLPHVGLVGIIDPAEADVVHNPAERITAVPISSFASLLGGEYLQFALDLNGRTLHFGVNGNWSSDPQNPAFGFSLARRAFAPAVIPSPADLHPYIADKFEFNFGGTPFRHPIPAGYRPFDVASGVQTDSPRTQRLAPMAHDIHEGAFLTAIRAFEQPFDSLTKTKLRETIDSWRAYRDAACRLTARFKKQKGSGMDANCVREFGGALLTALPKLQQWNRLSFDPPFDELPPIDLEQHPILHYVEVDDSDVSEDTAVLEDRRLVATVNVTDTSGPLILFLRAYGGTHWRITVKRGVKLQHVFLFGQYTQTANMSGSDAPIRSYSSEQDNSGKLWKVLHRGEHDPDSLAAALEELIGVAPTSIQQDCKNARCEIAAAPSKFATGESP